MGGIVAPAGMLPGKPGGKPIPMGPQARREYVAKMRRRYAAASRSERSRLLDELVAVAGFHRKSAIRAVRQERPAASRRRPPRRYGPDVVVVLIAIWKATDYPWSLRLKAMLPRWLPFARQHLEMSSTVEAALSTISARTIDRLLRGKRGEVRRRHYGRTKPGTLLKHQVPIRSQRWDVHEAGWCEIDTVAHCGGSLFGDFANSLNATDIASTWTETRVVLGKAQERIVAALDDIRTSLPFPLKGIDSDSGSEFINHHLVRYCSAKKVSFTRSRPYRKNDNAHIEQKNWTHVRKIFGWARVHDPAIVEAMNDLCRGELLQWMNLFQPSVKLVEKRRVGSRIIRIYDHAQTPLERLITLGTLSVNEQAALEAERDAIDPFELSVRIERKLGLIAQAIRTQSAAPPAHPHGIPNSVLGPKEALVQRAAHGQQPVTSALARR